MTYLASLILTLSFSALATTSSPAELQKFFIKQEFEKLEYNLKIEKEIMLTKDKVYEDLSLSMKNKKISTNMECVEWVYRGSASRTEAIKACHGVSSMECLEWVYRGSASREESAAVCRGNRSMECAEWVYRGSSSREESVEACRGVTDMECVEYAYRGSASRVESAVACSGGRRPGRRPRCE